MLSRFFTRNGWQVPIAIGFPMLKTLGFSIGFFVVALLAVIILRTVAVGPPSLPRTIDGKNPYGDIRVDHSVVASRLAGAIKIQTVSLSPDAPPPADAL